MSKLSLSNISYFTFCYQQTEEDVEGSKQTTSTMIWTDITIANQDETLKVRLSSETMGWAFESEDAVVNVLGKNLGVFKYTIFLET